MRVSLSPNKTANLAQWCTCHANDEYVRRAVNKDTQCSPKWITLKSRFANHMVSCGFRKVPGKTYSKFEENLYDYGHIECELGSRLR